MTQAPKATTALNRDLRRHACVCVHARACPRCRRIVFHLICSKQKKAWKQRKVGGNIPVLSAAGLIVALSAPFGCAEYMSADDVDHVNGSAKRRVLI